MLRTVNFRSISMINTSFLPLTGRALCRIFGTMNKDTKNR